MALLTPVVGTLSLLRPAWALDTVETWDAGAGNAELHLGFAGSGTSSADLELSGELIGGFGIVDRLSAYLVTSFAATLDFSEAVGGISLGIFGTPLDTDHVDLDLFLDFSFGGPGFYELRLGPALELNIDLRPDLERWGVYILVGVPLLHVINGSQDEDSRTLLVSVEATIGTYLTLGSRHQLLLAFEMAFHPGAAPDELVTEVRSVGLGYNVVLHEAVELIVEGRFDIPQGDEPFTAGVMVGMIATIPTAEALCLPSDQPRPEQQGHDQQHDAGDLLDRGHGDLAE